MLLSTGPSSCSPPHCSHILVWKSHSGSQLLWVKLLSVLPWWSCLSLTFVSHSSIADPPLLCQPASQVSEGSFWIPVQCLPEYLFSMFGGQLPEHLCSTLSTFFFFFFLQLSHPPFGSTDLARLYTFLTSANLNKWETSRIEANSVKQATWALSCCQALLNLTNAV